jgi:hypothetical protein
VIHMKVSIIVVVLLALTGCSQSQYGRYLSKPIFFESTTLKQSMDIAEEVLGDFNFTIVKADLDQGKIVTRPLAGGQILEFWRMDNIGIYNVVESNLQSIRKIATINIEPEANGVLILCNVQTERLSLPEYEVTGSARVYQMYTQSQQSLVSLQVHPEQQKDMAWISLGNDEELEKAILWRIQKKITAGRKKGKV